jgi:hypothetical protein
MKKLKDKFSRIYLFKEHNSQLRNFVINLMRVTVFLKVACSKELKCDYYTIESIFLNGESDISYINNYILYIKYSNFIK